MFYLLLTFALLPFLRRAPHAGGPRRILVVQTAKIGDVVMSTPVLGSLRASFPDARITLVHQPLTADIVRDHPWVDDRLELPPAALRGLRGKLRVARALRAGRFDTVLILSPSLPWLVVAAWAGMARRMSVMPAKPGRTMRMARVLLTDHVEHDERQQVAGSQLGLVALMGGTAVAEQHLRVGESAVDLPPALSGYSSLVGVGVSAANTLKTLDDRTLAAVCEGIAGLPGTAVLLIGNGSDREKAQRIRSLISGDAAVFDLTGRFSLGELTALLSRLRVFVGVDSGVTHMADALGVPQVVVSGPVHMEEVMPQTPGSRIIGPPTLPCAPCTSVLRTAYHCATGTHACVKATQPDQVVAAVEAIMAQRRALPGG